jgi:hypothetical protein
LELHLQVEARWKIDDKLWMKNSDGHWAILVWVVGREYNVDRRGWDYKLRQKDVDAAEAWLDGQYVRSETELKRA